MANKMATGKLLENFSESDGFPCRAEKKALSRNREFAGGFALRSGKTRVNSPLAAHRSWKTLGPARRQPDKPLTTQPWRA